MNLGQVPRMSLEELSLYNIKMQNIDESKEIILQCALNEFGLSNIDLYDKKIVKSKIRNFKIRKKLSKLAKLCRIKI